MKIPTPIFKLKHQAKLLSRSQNIPLHAALDQIAHNQGFANWSHLSAAEASRKPPRKVLETLKPGDLMLLAARPGQGKTVLGLQILLEAIKAGNKGIFFSLEYTEMDIWRQIKQSGTNPASLLNRLEVDTSDEINAHLIENRLAGNAKPTVAVIDYLQLLDQKRQNPELNVQLQQLANAARKHNAILIALSQVHRSYDLLSKTMPDWSDVKLPNPADLNLFNKGCFLHDGQTQILSAP